ncbi:ArnT family glycosyltransferase [Noviherbaspirillum galbum]|uniref:Glycosyltransferase family 39 protein n=1 Tax=Noviherbaspirillum galbum TaxID=2709383 RepID=A0A6B3SRG5_9BURK|nr:glycosyltransferase family 39 protein [Noviherbaspirillum galbum]NEX63520.1 glycosyltransferase family 39 protein [Noviherbaspirillum galbum]
MIGHDPWKQDETYIFGIVQHMLESGDWIVPNVANEPFMEKPPLYYWVAGILATLFSPWLAPHDGARLATGLFMGLTCGALAWTGNRWWGKGQGRLSVVAMLGSLGLVFYAHLMLTDIPILTGFALACCGFAVSRERPVLAGALLGTGAGIGFLSKGVLSVGVLGLTALILPIAFANWRQRAYFKSLAVAAMVSLPWLLIWPVQLYIRSPELFIEWFWLNNVGRFIGFSVATLGAPHKRGFWLETLPWFGFPCLPLAGYAAWRFKHELRTDARIQVPLVLFSVMMFVLAVSASARPNYALPLLVPVCLLATPVASRIPGRLNLTWDWGSRLVFSGIGLFIWGIWISIMVTGAPPSWQFLATHLPDDFNLQNSADEIAIASSLSLLAVLAWRRVSRTAARGLLSWTIGLTLCWGLLATLWLPWIDAAKSYRDVFLSMHSAMPQKHRCIASEGLGESERAMLRYVLGINTQRQEVVDGSDCDLLLINGLAKNPPADIDTSRWKLAWEGARRCDRRERFWLYVAK